MAEPECDVESTTCAFCLEECVNPRSLPCSHTFCLKCLEDYSGDKSDEQLVCPVCRSKIQIPENGFDATSEIKSKLAGEVTDSDMTSEVTEEDLRCEICKMDDEDDDAVTMATVFCVDCSQKLCGRCSRPHKLMKGRPHELIVIGTDDSWKTFAKMGHGKAGSCHVHHNTSAEVHCLDCRINVCGLCLENEHRKHESKEIRQLMCDFRKQLETEVQPHVDRIKSEIDRIDLEKNKFMESIRNVELSIAQRCQELKEMIDRQAHNLQQELNGLKAKILSEINVNQDRLNLALISLESFNTHCVELTRKSNTGKVVRLMAAGGFDARAREVLMICATFIGFVAPRFGLKLTANDRMNLIGRVSSETDKVGISEDEQQPAVERTAKTEDQLVQTLKTRLTELETTLKLVNEYEPHLVEHVTSDPQSAGTISITEGVTVVGVAILDSRLYVVCQKLGTASGYHIDVYDAINCNLIQSKIYERTRRANDVTSCLTKQCIIILPLNLASSVKHLQLDVVIISECPKPLNNPVSVHLKQPCLPSSLSFSPINSTVVATCTAERKLIKFSLDLNCYYAGDFLEISLHPDIVNPMHAVALFTDHFAVCHIVAGSPIRRVCIVGIDGNPIFTYGPHPLADEIPLKEPCYLACDDDRFVYVADFDRQQVLLLNPKLNLVRTIVSRDLGLNHGVRKMCLDTVGRRLCVADDKHVTVYTL